MRKFLCLAMAVLFVVVTACASVPEEHKGAATGAGIGAAGGAVTGAVLGRGSAQSAVLGGLVGALLGGAIGHYGYDQRRSGTETAQAYNYTPQQGQVVRIENAAVTPEKVSPGGTVDMRATYAVLNPSQGVTTNVTETREIRLGNEVVGKPQVNVARANGTYTSNVPLQLPQNAKPGVYTVVTTIQAGGAQDTRQSTFTVS